MSAQPQLEQAWRTRITRSGTIDPAELVANPANWRQHPRHQHEALRDLLGEVGWVQGVVVNETTGRLVDGHLRAELAVADGANMIPVVWVELSEEEERLVLATLDPIGTLAVADPTALIELLESLSPAGEALAGLLEDLGGQYQPGHEDDDGEEPADSDFWPFVRLQVSRETLAAWEQWWPTVAGADDDAKLQTIMNGD